MKNNELRADAARYLAQQLQRDKRSWVHPAKVGKLVEQQTGSGGSGGSAPDGNANGSPLEAIRQGMKHARQEWVAPSVKESGKKGEAMGQGAPEPEPVIPVPGEIENAFPAFGDLDSFQQAISGCMKCPLGATRNKFVYGVGDPEADLVLVGEAPGADEDRLGEPFIGRAGKLLDQILAAVDLGRGKGVYIANILKCRPPGNRDPLTAEVEQCEPHLVKQLQLLKPKVIMALGRIAAQTLLRSSEPLSKMRGRVHDYHGIPLMVTFHPAALLRNPNWKRPTWEDIQQMKALLEEKRSAD